jgi:hypothetical protein
VKLSFPTRRLPERPDLEQLRRQAKELLDAYRAGDEIAVAEVKRFYRGADPATFALHDCRSRKLDLNALPGKTRPG